MISSRNRVSEYVGMFAEIDTKRIEILQEIVKTTLESIDDSDSETAEVKVDELVDKLGFINEVAESIVTAFMENGAFTSGN